jgi:hypothetical protein
MQYVEKFVFVTFVDTTEIQMILIIMEETLSISNAVSAVRAIVTYLMYAKNAGAMHFRSCVEFAIIML